MDTTFTTCDTLALARAVEVFQVPHERPAVLASDGRLKLPVVNNWSNAFGDQVNSLIESFTRLGLEPHFIAVHLAAKMWFKV